jgi:hypothetical protein
MVFEQGIHNKDPTFYGFLYSPLVTLPPALYENLPGWVKKFFLFEFPFYSSNLYGETTAS